MQITKHDGGPERQALIGMVVSEAVLGPIAERWDDKHPMFASPTANLVAEWAVGHYKRYRKAPRRDIEAYYERWAGGGRRDPETVSMVNRFLDSLSEEYERQDHVTPEFVLDLAAEHFNSTRAQALSQEVEQDVRGGQVDRALKRISDFRKVEVGRGAGVSILSEQSHVVSAFSDDGNKEDLIVYPGAAGKFFQHLLCRDCFVALEGKAKVGKSYWLLDFAWRGMLQERRVAFFETGDMSKSQILRRFGSRAAKRPVYGDPNPVRLPTSIDRSGGAPEIQYDSRVFHTDLTGEEAWAAVERVGRQHGDRLRLSVHPNCSVSVNGIEEALLAWARDGWVADVICIDYADILAPMSFKSEGRDAINETWMALRSLSEKLHALVVTATQTDTASYRATTIDRSNFSGDRRKNDHVTAMIGINQTSDEKNQGVYRLNPVAVRELEFSEETCLYTAACLPLANPCVVSCF